MKQQSAGNNAFGKWIRGMALGAVAMYLADPDKGRRRRALARDQMQSMMHRTSGAIDVASRDLGNRMQGLRAQASRLLMRRDNPADDQLLEARVRSKIGRVISHPHAIKVKFYQGHAKLSGPIFSYEKEQLLEAVRSTPGVIDIEDNIEVHERADHVSSLQGEGRQRAARSILMQENWPPALCAIAAIGGGMLGFYGLRERSPLSMALALGGLGLMTRGLTNTPLRRIVGMDTRRGAIELQKTIYIAAAPETVFDFWSNVENLPHVMSNIQQVQDLGNGRSHWVVRGPAGMPVEWNAVTTQSRRPELLCWETEPDSMVRHAGAIRFEPTGEGTRIQVQMSYTPPAGMVGNTAASIFAGNPKREMDEDLLRVKTFIEQGRPPHDAAQPAMRPGSAVLH